MLRLPESYRQIRHWPHPNYVFDMQTVALVVATAVARNFSGGIMKAVRRAFSLVATLIVGLQCVAPVMAQTVLTGSAQTHAVTNTRIIKQQPVYDTYRAPAPLRSGASQVVVQRPVIQRVYVQDNRTYFQKHPKVKAATIGAGVGTAAGAVTGLVSGRGVVRGGLIGAGTGAGVGLVRSSATMKRHPIANDVATGSLVGLGIGAAASRGHKRALQGTGVGAAVGLGVGLLRNGLH